MKISGPIPSESLAEVGPRLRQSCWRTSQASLWEVMDGHHMGAPWSDSFPKSGMTRNGELYPLPIAGAPHLRNRWWLLAYPNADLGRRLHSGIWTKSPFSGQQSDDLGGCSPLSNREHCRTSLDGSRLLIDHGPHRPEADAPIQGGNEPKDRIDLSEMIGLFPTPVADGDRQTNYAQGGTSLGFAARMLYPRPERRCSRLQGLARRHRRGRGVLAGETRRRQGRHATAGSHGEVAPHANKR